MEYEISSNYSNRILAAHFSLVKHLYFTVNSRYTQMADEGISLTKQKN